MSKQNKAAIAAGEDDSCHGLTTRATDSNPPCWVGHVSPTFTHVGFSGGGSAFSPTNENGPRRGARGTQSQATGSDAEVAGELATLRLDEPGGAALGGHLPQNGALHGGDNVAELGPLGGHQQKGVVTLCR